MNAKGFHLLLCSIELRMLLLSVIEMFSDFLKQNNLGFNQKIEIIDHLLLNKYLLFLNKRVKFAATVYDLAHLFFMHIFRCNTTVQINQTRQYFNSNVIYLNVLPLSTSKPFLQSLKSPKICNSVTPPLVSLLPLNFVCATCSYKML